MPVKPFAAAVTDNRLHSGACRQSLGSDAGTGFGRRHRHGCHHQIVREYSTIRPVTSLR